MKLTVPVGRVPCAACSIYFPPDPETGLPEPRMVRAVGELCLPCRRRQMAAESLEGGPGDISVSSIAEVIGGGGDGG